MLLHVVCCAVTSGEKVDISCKVFVVGYYVVNLDGTLCAYTRMSCANGCVVVLDCYLPRAFFRSGVSGVGVLMHALCLFDGRGVWCRCY